MATSMAYAMLTKLSIALVEMDKKDKKGKIGKMAIKMGTVGIPIGVRIVRRDHDAGHEQHHRGQHRSGRQRHVIEPAGDGVGDADARGDHGHR